MLFIRFICSLIDVKKRNIFMLYSYRIRLAESIRYCIYKAHAVEWADASKHNCFGIKLLCNYSNSVLVKKALENIQVFDDQVF